MKNSKKTAAWVPKIIKNTNCTYIHIHSGYFYSTSTSPLLFRRAPNYTTDIVLELHAETPHATASDGLAQGPYVAARAGFEPTPLRTKGDESTNEPPCLTLVWIGPLSYHREVWGGAEARLGGCQDIFPKAKSKNKSNHQTSS